MHELICPDCGITYFDGTDRCPHCGAPAPGFSAADGAENDPTAQLTRTLLYQARQCQQRGNLIEALKFANDALALRPHCSTIHALLGALYEQKGELAAARHHFQKALTVTPPVSRHDECVLPELPELPMVRTVPSNWVLPALIGCLLFSGLAALFTLWPLDRQVEKSGFIKVDIRDTRQRHLRAPKLHQTPRATPAAAPKAVPIPPPPAPPAVKPETATPSGSLPRTAVPSPAAPVVPDTPPRSIPALGPPATDTVPMVPDNPTIEQADQAYFDGDHERAVLMYEKLLVARDDAHPRIHQHLAGCYRSLGNTPKARTHLGDAILGYELQLKLNPQDNAANMELRSCRTALESLNMREAPATP